MVSGAVWESSQPSYSFTLRQRQAMADALGVEKVLLVTELDRDADGVRVVPDGEVAVVDDDSGNVVVFTSH